MQNVSCTRFFQQEIRLLKRLISLLKTLLRYTHERASEDATYAEVVRTGKNRNCGHMKAVCNVAVIISVHNIAGQRNCTFFFLTVE